MSDPSERKKRVESYVLTCARAAGVPIPTGEVPGEEPDFRFQTPNGGLGIEVTELIRPASSNSGIVPVEAENFHKQLIRSAQAEYYRVPGAIPVYVQVYFANARGKRQNKQSMSRSLVELVRANAHRDSPVLTLSGTDVPQGFSCVTIVSDTRDWWSGEIAGHSIEHISEQLADRINAKDELVPTYRKNLPSVARSMSIPYGIEEWRFPFSFDRVFWFAALENQVVEIRRSE